MIISRDLIKQVNDTQGTYAPDVVKLTLIVALLEGLVKRNVFDELIAQAETQRGAQGVMQSEFEFGRIVTALKRRVDSTSPDGINPQFVTDLTAYAESKRFPGRNMEVGHPQAQLTADLILGTSYGRSPASVPAAPLDNTEKAMIAGGTVAVATVLENQAQAITGQVMGDMSAQASNAIGGGISDMNTAIGKSIGNTFKGAKEFLMGTAGSAGTGSMAAASTTTGSSSGFMGKIADLFKGKTKSDMVLPVAVILAVGLGGAFGWRRYIKHRKNQRLAREMARDTELRRQMERLVADSGMSKYAGQPEAVDAVRAVENQELRQPYMRGY